jgi:hypothetical protein
MALKSLSVHAIENISKYCIHGIQKKFRASPEKPESPKLVNHLV